MRHGSELAAVLPYAGCHDFMPSIRKLALVVPVLVALFGCRLIDRLRGDSDTKPPNVPAPPAAMAFAQADPVERARAAAVVLRDDKKRLSAWLGVYDAVGIPVLDADKKAIGKATDLPGPFFWQVWLSSGLDKPGAGVPLADVARILQIGLRSPQDYAAVAKALLEDLRAATKSKSPELRFLAELVRERIRTGRSHADILDPKTDANAVIDIPTVALVAWAVNRAVLVRVLAGATGQTGTLETPTPRPSQPWPNFDFELVPNAHAAGGKFKCSEMLGDKDTTSWVKGLLKFLGGGVKIQLAGSDEKVGFSKTSEQIAKAMGGDSDEIKNIGKFVGWANAVSSILSFAMQMYALEMRIDSTPDKLTRTKNTTQGKEQKHRVQIVFDTAGKFDGNEMRSCIASMALNTYGVSLKIPEDGKALAKVGVKFGAGVGFDRVMFGNNEQLAQKTDDKGFVDLLVIGRAQSRSLPDSAKPYDAEYSFFTEAQSEPDDLSSIGNMFWGSFKSVANPSPASAVGPILQLLKVLHYNLGEQSFVVVDWKPPGWKVDGAKQEATFSGQICDVGKPFAVKIGGGASGFLNYTPDAGYPTSGGKYSYSGSYGPGSIYGSGTYTLSGDPWSKLKLTQTGTGCVTHPMGTSCEDGVEILSLTVVDSCTPTAGH